MTGNSIRYKCLEMALSLILNGSRTRLIIGDLKSVFCFILEVFLENLILKAIEEAVLSSHNTLDFRARLDLRKSMFKGGVNGPIL